MNKVSADKKSLEELFERYVSGFYPSRVEAERLLTSGKRLKFYLGIDPTGPDIHLGHVTNLLLLKKLALLGHETIVLVGDFTALIGDPTDKEATRKPLSQDEINQNLKGYIGQIGRVLPVKLFKVEHNSKWYNKMNLNYFLSHLARRFTVWRILERDMFEKRRAKEAYSESAGSGGETTEPTEAAVFKPEDYKGKEGKPITIEEIIYPLMQGYDSVAMEVDGEIGGTDQTFNMLVGRDLVLSEFGKEKIVLTTPLLENPRTGKKLMNKSEGGYVSLNDEPEAMYGKIMSLPDETILPLLRYVTETSGEHVEEIARKIKEGANPMVFKKEAAFKLVAMVSGDMEAKKAQAEFDKVFSEGGTPENIRKFSPEKGRNAIKFALVDSGVAASVSEVKRLAGQNGIKINGKAVNDINNEVKAGDTIRVGPRRFIKIGEQDSN